MITTSRSHTRHCNLHEMHLSAGKYIYWKDLETLEVISSVNGSFWSLWYAWRQVACTDTGKADEWVRAGSVLKMEEVANSKSSASIYRNTRRHFSQDRSASSPPWELESHILSMLKFIFTYCDLFPSNFDLKLRKKLPRRCNWSWNLGHIAQLRQQCHNSKFMIFQEKRLEVLKCYNFLWVQRRHNCCPAASFANCVMALYLLKVHLQTFLSIPVTQKCQILSCSTHVANEQYRKVDQKYLRSL